MVTEIAGLVLARPRVDKLASLIGHHQSAIDRLNTAEQLRPNVDWSDVRIELLIRARDFSAAEQVLQDVLNKKPRGAIRNADRLLIVQSLRKMEIRFKSASLRATRDIVSFCINLDEHHEKWQRSQREGIRSNMELHRIPGVKGGYLPDSLLPVFGGNVSRNFKGTLGCFLSHFAAWDRLLASEFDNALIVEDDFRPKLSMPASIAALGVPRDYDVCFLNERMQTKKLGDFDFVRVPDVISMRATPKWRACGNEGYLVSRQGAEKLVRQLLEDGFYGDSDWRLLTYSVDRSHIEKLGNDSFAKTAMKAHLKAIRERTPLNAYAASIGLIGLVDTGSGREEQNSGKHAHEDPPA